jgi:Ran GTPase-activating protein (RanGAP) involved in mRNA processing and transport
MVFVIDRSPDRGPTYFADALGKLAGNTVTTYVDLSWEDLSAEELGRSVGTLLASNGTITSLVMRGCSLRGASFRHLAHGLRSNTSLTRLDLLGNPLGDEGACCLAEALLVATLPLDDLDVTDCQIGAAGASFLGEALERNVTLQRIWMHQNPLGASGSSGLFAALARNTTLRHLHLNDCSLDAEPLEAFLSENRALRSLHVSKNPFGDKGVRHIAAGLSANSALEELGLMNVGLSDAGVGSLGEALATARGRRNRTLRLLQLNDPLVTDAGAVELLRALAGHPALAMLIFEWASEGSSWLAPLRDALRSPGTALQYLNSLSCCLARPLPLADAALALVVAEAVETINFSGVSFNEPWFSSLAAVLAAVGPAALETLTVESSMFGRRSTQTYRESTLFKAECHEGERLLFRARALGHLGDQAHHNHALPLADHHHTDLPQGGLSGGRAVRLGIFARDAADGERQVLRLAALEEGGALIRVDDLARALRSFDRASPTRVQLQFFSPHEEEISLEFATVARGADPVTDVLFGDGPAEAATAERVLRETAVARADRFAHILHSVISARRLRALIASLALPEDCLSLATQHLGPILPHMIDQY